MLCACLFFLAATCLKAQNQRYETRKTGSDTPVIDGLIDEPVWSIVQWEDDFTQRQPHEGEPPSQQTMFRILYDDEHLYVAIHALDQEPEKIEKRLDRRDNMEGDWVSVEIDSYFDHLTAFEFAVNASGVKYDALISSDGDNNDETWDPVWDVRTTVDSAGWTAEMRIPMTQLRFAKNSGHIWGLQVIRWLHRKEELSAWKHIPMESSSWVSLFGELHGITDLRPKREIELIPFGMAGQETCQPEEGNPFADGNQTIFNAGLDGKIAVTNDLTLNFTVNPDFGQVEADPSEVNLTAFETFFQEKRPFFIEGNNIYNYSLTTGDSQLSQDNLFYSRRIGRRPHHEPELLDGEYADLPEFTHILGAFKLSGKTRNGWSVGVLESMTSREQATVDLEGQRRKETVEPFTNYLNARLQKDFNKGETILGGMMTSTARLIHDDPLKFLPRTVHTGGFDFTTYWKNKTYYLSAKTAFSHVAGSTDAVTRLQESPVRYFQRPDAIHLGVDSSRTSLTGHGGCIDGGKIGEGHWRYMGYLTWRSPGLELNDMGYLRQADIIQQVFWVGYRIWEPFSIFRNINVNLNQWTGWDFSGTNLFNGGNINFNVQFRNFWSLGSGIDFDTESISRSELRGGLALLFPGDLNIWYDVESDERKRLVVSFGGFNNWGGERHSRFVDFYMDFTYRPITSLSLSVSPSYEKAQRSLQFVTTAEYGQEDRYIIARIDREMLSADLRISLSLTPDLSLQFWGQPFLFGGEYSEFKRVTDPMADRYSDRFHIFKGDEIHYDENGNTYLIDEDLDGSVDYSFEKPDFNVFEFRSNFVARWEYMPGSSVYLVWSQSRDGYEELGRFRFGPDMDRLFGIVPHNIFLAKISYRISK